MKKQIMAALMALSLLSPAMAGVYDYELEAGGAGVSHDLVFVAKTDEAVILTITHKGFADNLADQIVDDGTDTTYGFAFGQPNGGTDPNAWENYSMNILSPLNGDHTQEICGDATANAADDNQAIKIFEATSEVYTTTVSGATIELAGSCSVGNDPAGFIVTASAVLGYEAISAGSATVDLQMVATDGIDADLVTPNPTKSFDTFTITETHFDAAQSQKLVGDLTSGMTLAHGDYGQLDIDLTFAVTGPAAKAERRSSILLIGAVTL